MVKEGKGQRRRNRHGPIPPPNLAGHYIFCPQQIGVEGPNGIPIIEYRYRGGPLAFKKLMRRRWQGARRIASRLIGRNLVPVTPLLNPMTGRSSYHIIRLIDELKPDYCVELLFMDTNAYLVAFRRQLRAEGGNWFGRTWFRYDDVKDLPDEIEKEAVPLPFNSSHKSKNYITPRDINMMHHMFEILSSCEDYHRDEDTGELLDYSDSARVEGALLKAIVIFSEAFRFRCLYLAMLEKPLDEDQPRTIDPETWNLIHNWDQCGVQVLELWKNDLPPLHTKAPEWFDEIKVRRPSGSKDLVNLSTLDAIIDERGELMLINASIGLIATEAKLKSMTNCLKKKTCSPIPEPGFD